MFLQNEPHTNGLQNKNFQNWPLREWFTEHKVNDLQNTNRKVYHSKLIISVYTVISNKIILLKTGKYKTNWYTTERIKSLQLMFDLLINIIWISADIKSLGCSYRP